MLFVARENQVLLKKKDISNYSFTMNKIIKNFLMTGDKFMPELCYSACGPFT